VLSIQWRSWFKKLDKILAITYYKPIFKEGEDSPLPHSLGKEVGYKANYYRCGLTSKKEG